MPRDKATEPEPEPTEAEGAAFIPSDEELTSPTSDDVGEQTKTAADDESAEDESEAEEEG